MNYKQLEDARNDWYGIVEIATRLQYQRGEQKEDMVVVYLMAILTELRFISDRLNKEG